MTATATPVPTWAPIVNGCTTNFRTEVDGIVACVWVVFGDYRWDIYRPYADRVIASGGASNLQEAQAAALAAIEAA